MKRLKLVRVTEHNDAQFGVLCINDKPCFVTLEDIWRNNERSISCIPKGKYQIKLHTSPKFGKCYKINDVPDRSEILIHAGNTDADTHGCILLGMMYGLIGTKSAILSSRAAVDSFMVEMAGEDGELEII